MRLRGNRDRISSPYLLDHVDNPVDWWAWSEAAFDEARRRDVPIFLSIGYSACHWCHVMAHESFEDPALAEILNARFVSIKVDREERPDIDAIYMDATVALTGHGGWPMSVFLDHQGRPFYAGTYFPPQPRHGLPSFGQLLQALGEAWEERRGEVEGAGERITEALGSRSIASTAEEPPDDASLQRAIAALERDFDERHGGFGGAPKFPPSMALEFCLREWARTGNATARRLAERTLEAMARGGMYDRLGGGFARYSVDAAWVVPHFEKMLYDNALLLRVYAHWWRQSGSPLARHVVQQTAGFLLRELRTEEGGFAAALDADSEGVEGKFYAWSPALLVDALGYEDGTWAAELLRVTDAGTFEHGLSTLQLPVDPSNAQRWEAVRTRLLARREERVRPARDDKVVAAWNGLVIAALADAGAILDEPSWIEAAAGAATLLVDVHLQEGSRLLRTSRDGRPGSSEGVLADYADVAEGFLALVQASGDDTWLERAGALLDVALAHFGDGEGGFYDTPDDGPALVRRPRDPGDNAEPSGWFAMAQACLTYASLTGQAEYRGVAERAVGLASTLADRAPRSVGTGLSIASALLAGPIELAVVGEAGVPGFAELLRAARSIASPGAVIAFGPQGSAAPLLRGRPLRDGRATAYLCRGFACRQPTADPAELVEQARN
ncbi:MAG: thioredoxin domain-containing protein [Actinomycetales bacterium]|nr:thioredoxin domain-containing protein [Actinomycetales bacterium]